MSRLYRYLIYVVIIGFSVALMMSDSEASIPPLGKVIELEALTLSWKNHLPGGRDALLYPHEPKQSIELEMDMDVLRFLYLDTRVYGLQDETQYRGVGLNPRVGVRITDWVRFEWEHDSKHRLDEQYPVMWRFPVDNSWNLIFDLYRAPVSNRRALL